jgi:hypothetical protein
MFFNKIIKNFYIFFTGIKRVAFSFSNKFISNKQVIFVDLKDCSLVHYYPCFLLQLEESDFHLVFNKFNLKFNGLEEGSFKKFWTSKKYEFLSFNSSVLIYPKLIYITDNINSIKSKNKFNIKSILINFDFFSVINSKLSNKIFPMSKHPSFYLDILVTASPDIFSNSQSFNIIKTKRKKFKIIFSGNVDYYSYNRSHLNTYFNINTRFQIIQHLEKFFPACYIYNNENNNNPIYLNYWGSNTGSLSCNDGILDLNEWVELLKNTNFILALPGCQMPHCWSLIEAISFGVIPIIQKGYAETMNPPLEHLTNCIIFNDLEDLITVCLNVLDYSDNEIAKLSENIKIYYEKFYSSNSIKNLISSLKDLNNELFLNTETRSLLVLLKNSNFSKSKNKSIYNSIYSNSSISSEFH